MQTKNYELSLFCLHKKYFVMAFNVVGPQAICDILIFCWVIFAALINMFVNRFQISQSKKLKFFYKMTYFRLFTAAEPYVGLKCMRA